MSFTVAPIVEGYGDVPAVRVLLANLAPELLVATPVRQPRNKLVTQPGLRHAVNIAAANIRGRGAVLIVFDSDEDCAAELARKLSSWLVQDFAHLTCRVAIAVREFEAWIVGGDPAYGVDDPDAAGNMEGRIKQAHGVYRKTVDQPRHIAKADIERLCRNSRSFRRFFKVVAEFRGQTG